jgi:hypothetical protein
MRRFGAGHFVFDTGPRFDLCYAALPLDPCRACLHIVRTMLPWNRCVWCPARRQWHRMGRDGLRRSPSVRPGHCRPALSRRACRGWQHRRNEKRDETVECGLRGLETGRDSTEPATCGRDGQGRRGTVRSGARRRRTMLVRIAALHVSLRESKRLMRSLFLREEEQEQVPMCHCHCATRTRSQGKLL